MQARVVTSLAEVEALAPAWEALADACRAGPFSRPGYALTWWRHAGHGRLLVCVVHDEDGALVALAPLHSRRVGPLRVGRWLGHGLGTVAEALVSPQHPEAAASMWAALRSPGLVLQLTETREGAGGLEALVHDTTRTTSCVPRNRCPVVVLDPATDVLAGSGRRRIRRTLRVAAQRVAEAGLELHVETATDVANLDRLLPDVRAVYDEAEEGRDRLHFLRGEWEPFTLDLLRSGVASGGVVVHVGYLDERPVCFDLLFRCDDRLYAWVGRYAPWASTYSPGHLLQRAGLDWAARHGVRSVDLLLGDDAYKRRWANGGYDTLEVVSGVPATMALVAPVLRRLARRHDASEPEAGPEPGEA
ncbi:GNAT family N-acetyltransferase [Nocardioides rubriscoriae]|uniref:GNAT family N-acetyltransferase n=1 Tax=Nocardioides rubriscoriae TaxID=642762 RepID=UPI0014782C6F|nr:GNAT family N-acetyltransferase [Nocardioides rubriscoriae]